MLRTTVIAKTDLVKSTQRIRSLTDEQLDSLLASQSSLITPIVEAHQGTVVKGEGDAFWLTFPSVTAAALAAVDMQRALRHSQHNIAEPDRLAMRVAIALGDVLHRSDDLFGPAMALTARIESVTPADEIYLSHAAWLALNQAQVESVFVDTFVLKGFDQPEAIYRILQRDAIRIENNQIVVASDLGGFTRFVAEHPLEDVAAALNNYEALVLTHLTPNNGKLRVMAGDTFLITFELASDALIASEQWVQAWVSFSQQAGYDLRVRLGITKGPFYMFRTHLFGSTINNSVWLARWGADLCPTDSAVVLLSKDVKVDLQDTAYAQRLKVVSSADSHSKFQQMPPLSEAFQLML